MARVGTTVATANLKRGLPFGTKMHAIDRLIHQGADVINLQEIYGASHRLLRRAMARQGYGVIMQNDVPIAYNLKRFKLVGAGSQQFSHYQSTFNPARYGNYAALKDRKTGRIQVFTNTHLTAGSGANGKLFREMELKRLAKMQADLRKQYGKNANYYIAGDFNTGDEKKLHSLTRGGLKGTRGAGPVDYIFAEQRARDIRRLRTASDHDAFLATYYDKVKQPPHQGGEGGGGGNHPGGGNGGGNNNGGGDVPLSAYDLFSELLQSWGVPVGHDIESIIRHAVVEGYTPDQIELIIPDIQKTKSWNQRFPGWAERVKNGYSQLSVDEYLNLENTYRRTMEEAGLPKGFYDSPSDFGHWIANNVSPDEIQSRVQIAVNAAKSIDPTARRLMAQYYGLSTGDVASYFLDQKRALPVIERQYNAANVASWAERNGLDVSGMKHYEDLVDKGVTADQAAQGYGTVKTMTDTFGKLAGVYGDTYNQSDAESDVFFGQSDKRRKLTSQEAATFGGSSSGATGTAKRQSY